MVIDFWPASLGVLSALIAWRFRRAWPGIGLAAISLGILGLIGWGAYELHTRYPDWWRYLLGAIFLLAMIGGASQTVEATWSAFWDGAKEKPADPSQD